MEIEIPVSRIQVNNRLIDAVTVEVIRTDSLGLWIEVGRTQAGYHYSVTYAVPTGGGIGGVHTNSPRAKDKTEALLGGLREAAKKLLDHTPRRRRSLHRGRGQRDRKLQSNTTDIFF